MPKRNANQVQRKLPRDAKRVPDWRTERGEEEGRGGRDDLLSSSLSSRCGRLAPTPGDAESALPTEPIGRGRAGLGSLLSLGRDQRCKLPKNQILKIAKRNVSANFICSPPPLVGF